MLSGTANGAQEGDWHYRDWTSEDTALGDVTVDFRANLERKSEEQTVVVVVCAAVEGPALMCVGLVDIVAIFSVLGLA